MNKMDEINKGWGLKFKQNLGMADVLNLEIHERSNGEPPNLGVTKIGNDNWENWFISKGKYKNWRNCE